MKLKVVKDCTIYYKKSIFKFVKNSIEDIDVELYLKNQDKFETIIKESKFNMIKRMNKSKKNDLQQICQDNNIKCNKALTVQEIKDLILLELYS